ncbi:MAG: carbohydrate ABC transporter permease [Actinobacteria bacterium]|nr:carbohydrate ABC transporter permease [Actinomycetota bacterium]
MSKKIVIGIIKYLVLVISISAILLPLLYVISIGFMHHDDVYAIFPKMGFTLENIPEAIRQTVKFAQITFTRTMINSFVVSTGSIIGIIIVSILAAYAFSAYNFRFKEPIFITFLISFMIPVQVLLIPLFVLMKNLKLLNSYLVLILPYIAIHFPIAVLILRGFFEKIPIEIKEAAKIDGASDTRILTNVVLPISKPAIATVITFSFMMVWNEFLFALVFIRKEHLQTLPIVLNLLQYNPHGIVHYEVYGAFIFLSLIPEIIIFIFFQRWFIAGLSAGAVKG